MELTEFHTSPATYPHHITLIVSNIETSLLFYEQQLGFSILKQTKNRVVLSANQVDPIITLESVENVTQKAPRQIGLFHLALLLPTRQSLALLIKRLLEANYPVQGASDHGVSEAFYLADPDGNGIELYRDREAKNWSFKNERIVMTTEALDVEDLLSVAEGRGWEGLPLDTTIGHVHFHVQSLDPVVTFYRDLLGFSIMTYYGDQAVFMADSGYHHHLAFNVWAGPHATTREPNQVGMKDLSIRYPSEKEREIVVERLKEHRFTITIIDGDVQVVDPAGAVLLLNVTT